jgi:hypothetical protein
VALVLDYAEMIAPAGAGVSFQSEGDRRAIVTLHRWSWIGASRTRTTWSS